MTSDTETARCRCGHARRPWQAFCPCCYGKLPIPLANAVAEGHGPVWDAAVREASRWLDARDLEQLAKRLKLTAR